LGAVRWWVMPVFVVAALAAIVSVRMAMWPCGGLDRVSGCISRVALDMAELGLDPATARVDWNAFDLGPGAGQALVGISGPGGAGWRGVLALFDARTGALIRVVADAELADADLDQPFVSEAAFSGDGTMIAAGFFDWEASEVSMALKVFALAEGAMTSELPMDFSNGRECQTMLDFSPDGMRLQCGGTVYDLATLQATSAYDADGMMLPMYAEFPPGERAPDGTVVRSIDLPTRTTIFDGDAGMYFAPDSVGLLEVWRAYRENRGQRWWTPAPFRELAAVGVWDGQTVTLQRRFYANERYLATAWARDGGHFGFVSEDFHLSVFQR
jgi:hypothetical protein